MGDVRGAAAGTAGAGVETGKGRSMKRPREPAAGGGGERHTAGGGGATGATGVRTRGGATAGAASVEQAGAEGTSISGMISVRVSGSSGPERCPSSSQTES